MLLLEPTENQRLWRGITRGDPEAVRSALAAGATPNLKVWRRPVLIQAIRCLGQRQESLDIVAALLAAGADPNARDARSCTALSYTALRCRLGEPHDRRYHKPPNQESIRFFTDAARLPLTTNNQWSLEAAADMMIMLVDAGASIQVPMGHVGRFEGLNLAPWGVSSTRTLSSCVFQTLLSVARHRQASPSWHWRRLTSLIPHMEVADLERPVAGSWKFYVHGDHEDTPLMLAMLNLSEETVLAFLHRGVTTRLPCHQDTPELGITPPFRDARTLASFLVPMDNTFQRFALEKSARTLENELPTSPTSPLPRNRL